MWRNSGETKMNGTAEMGEEGGDVRGQNGCSVAKGFARREIFGREIDEFSESGIVVVMRLEKCSVETLVNTMRRVIWDEGEVKLGQEFCKLVEICSDIETLMVQRLVVREQGDRLRG